MADDEGDVLSREGLVVFRCVEESLEESESTPPVDITVLRDHMRIEELIERLLSTLAPGPGMTLEG